MYNFEVTLEENLAFEIYQIINSYDSKCKGYASLHYDSSILEKLSFAILNREAMTGKHNLFTYVLKEGTNIKSIETHLMTIGIRRVFEDNSNPNEKRYLAIQVVD